MELDRAVNLFYRDKAAGVKALMEWYEKQAAEVRRMTRRDFLHVLQSQCEISGGSLTLQQIEDIAFVLGVDKPEELEV